MADNEQENQQEQEQQVEQVNQQEQVQEQEQPIIDTQSVDKQGGKSRFWPALIGGAAAGAVIVGAVWAILAAVHPSDPLVAKVGNYPIHASDFHKQLEAQQGQQTLQQMIEEQLIKQGAKAKNITATTAEINQQKQSIETQYGISSSTQLAMFLAQNGMTTTQFNDIIKVDVLEQKLSEQGVKVTNQEITDYYNKNKSSFTPPGSKTPQPLSKVRSQIIAAIKQSKATPGQQLVANLAKQQNITIYDTTYSGVKSQIENPPANAPSGSGAAPGTPSGSTSNSGS